MYITSISISNIKSFRSFHEIKTSKSINILIGKNNAGKSTIIKSIYTLQGGSIQKDDIAIGHNSSSITIGFSTDKDHYEFNNFPQILTQ